MFVPVHYLVYNLCFSLALIAFLLLPSSSLFRIAQDTAYECDVRLFTVILHILHEIIHMARHVKKKKKNTDVQQFIYNLCEVLKHEIVISLKELCSRFVPQDKKKKVLMTFYLTILTSSSN